MCIYVYIYIYIYIYIYTHMFPLSSQLWKTSSLEQKHLDSLLGPLRGTRFFSC